MTVEPPVSVGILGPVEAIVSGESLSLGGPKQRAVLAVLAASVGRVVPTHDLLDAVWGEDAGERAGHTLQVYVSNLRKILEPEREGEARIIVRQSPGYLLDQDLVAVDATRFEELHQQARSLLAVEPERAADRCAEALALWRGEAFADLRGDHWFDAASARLEESRLLIEEDRVEAQLAAGGHRDVIARLEQLIADHPFRERFRSQLMLALYRSGRQADALAAYSSARNALVEELGIEPTEELRQLEQAILAQDPALLIPTEPSDDKALEAEALATIDTRGGDLPGPAILLPDGQQIALGRGRILIGRTPDANLRFFDNRVSRQHAAIESRGDHHYLVDLGSTNGTSANGVRIEGEHQLADGDCISLGGVELQIRA